MQKVLAWVYNSAILRHTNLNSIMQDETNPPRTLNRGIVRKSRSVLVTAWVPKDLAEALDAQVEKQDTDRSKLLRRALRQFIKTA